MKKLLLSSLVVLLFGGCGSMKNSFDPSFLLKNPWVVQSILGNKVDVSKFGNGLPFIEFLADGKITGFDGCNRFNGSVEVGAKTLNLGPLASTRMFCPDIDSDKFMDAINQVTGFTKNGDLLELTGAAGSLLTFLPTTKEE